MLKHNWTDRYCILKQTKEVVYTVSVLALYNISCNISPAFDLQNILHKLGLKMQNKAFIYKSISSDLKECFNNQVWHPEENWLFFLKHRDADFMEDIYKESGTLIKQITCWFWIFFLCNKCLSPSQRFIIISAERKRFI